MNRAMGVLYGDVMDFVISPDQSVGDIVGII